MQPTIELIKKDKNGKESIVPVSAIFAVDIVKTRNNFSYPEGMNEEKALAIAKKIRVELESNPRVILTRKHYTRRHLENMELAKLTRVYEIYFSERPETLEKATIINDILLKQYELGDTDEILKAKTVDEDSENEPKNTFNVGEYLKNLGDITIPKLMKLTTDQLWLVANYLQAEVTPGSSKNEIAVEIQKAYSTPTKG
jgi:hypothetical protein